MSTENARPSALGAARSRMTTAITAVILRNKPYALDFVMLGAVFVVMYVAMIKLQNQFYPDSAHYLAMSLWFSGMSREDALQVVLLKSLELGYEPNTDPALLFDWGLVKPRVVLPLLSVPFIWMFGPNGLIVTTGIITVVLFALLYFFLRSRYGRIPAVVSLLLCMSSLAIMSFSIGMLTESLSAVWGVLALLLAYRFQRDRRARWILLLVLVTVLSAFTRQATFIVAGAFVVAWVMSLFFASERSKWTFPALAVAGTSLIVQVVQTALFPFSQGDQYLRMTQTDSLGEAIQATPRFVFNLLVAEFSSYVIVDQVLVIFVVLSIISMVLFWRRTESHLLFGAILGIALYNITNGNATQFRYAIPGLVFFVASISLVLAQIQSSVRLNRLGSANDQQPIDLETPTAASPRS